MKKTQGLEEEQKLEKKIYLEVCVEAKRTRSSSLLIVPGNAQEWTGLDMN